MQRRSHSLSDHSALHLALITFVCVVMGLLSGSAPTLAGTIHDRVEQIESANHTAVPMVCHDRFAQDLPEVLAEAADPTDEETVEEETKEYILRSDLAAFISPTGLHESPSDRAALTPFRLLAFSSRGSPSV